MPPVVGKFLSRAGLAGWLTAGAGALAGLAGLQLAWLALTFRFPCAELCTEYCTVRAGAAASAGSWFGGHAPASLAQLPEVLGSAFTVLAGLFLAAAVLYVFAGARFGAALADLWAAEGWPGLRRALGERAGPLPVWVLVVALPGVGLCGLVLLGSALAL